MEIILVDDGVNNEYYAHCRAQENYEITESLDVTHLQQYNRIVNTHGTVCAAIIKNYAPEATLTSIKVINNSTRPDKKNKLLVALQWCLTRNAPLVQMSIGSTYPGDFEDLRRALLNLMQNGSIIVAAYDNKNIFTVPAGFSFVIGVKNDPQYRDGHISLDHTTPCVLASGRHKLIDCKGAEEITQPCNSYAAPLVTAIVHNILQKYGMLNLKTVLDKLYQYSGKKLEEAQNLSCSYLPDFVGNHTTLVSGYGQKESIPFFFNVKKQITKVEELSSDLVDIVIIPEHDDQHTDFIEYLLQQKVRVNSILYAGRPTKRKTDEYVRGFDCLYWDESLLLQFYNNNMNISGNVEVPIIAIVGEQEDAILTISKLNDLFVSEGFSVILAGTVERSYLYGFHLVLTEIIGQCLYYIYSHYTCDLILLAYDKHKTGSFISDFTIQVLPDQQSVFDYGGNYIKMSSQDINGSMLIAIKNRIKEHFLYQEQIL